MAQGVWIDPATGWKAYGDVQSDGSMQGVTVDDNNGMTRTTDNSFSSKSDFFSWAKRIASRGY